MDDVDMDKLIDLIEMSHERVELDIDGMNIKQILERDYSKDFLD
jgi:hypothetical protein